MLYVPSKINGDNLSNIKCEAAGIKGIKKGTSI
jgi:hypothetical protein